MMDCAFIPFGSVGRWTCPRCNVPTPLGRIYEKPPRRTCSIIAAIETCVARRKTIGFQLCETCNGNVRIKTFACDIHGKCTLKKQLPGIACCATCKDFSPADKHHPDPDDGRSA